MASQEDINDQQELLAAHRKTLVQLLKQQALLGEAFAPPSVAHGIQDARKQIRKIKHILRDWGALVTDLPYDEDNPIAQPRKLERSTYILIVDDDDEYRKHLCQLVETIGYETKEANTNQQAHEFLFNSRMSFALVMTDALRRPERHGERGYVGLNLVQIINSQIPGLPVILVSRDSPQSLKQRAPTLRVQAVVGKNLSDGEIVTMIRSVLDGETLPDPWT